MTNTINYIGASRFPENEETYLAELLSIVGHADPSYDMTIDNRGTSIVVHIKPSDIQFRQAIITNLLHLNRTKGTHRLHFSSSLALSKTISFKLSTDKLSI